MRNVYCVDNIFVIPSLIQYNLESHNTGISLVFKNFSPVLEFIKHFVGWKACKKNQFSTPLCLAMGFTYACQQK